MLHQTSIHPAISFSYDDFRQVDHSRVFVTMHYNLVPNGGDVLKLNGVRKASKQTRIKVGVGPKHYRLGLSISHLSPSIRTAKIVCFFSDLNS